MPILMQELKYHPIPHLALSTNQAISFFTKRDLSGENHRYRSSKEARLGAELLASRFFMRDKYPDRADTAFWFKFSFPFWFTDLLSALDSISVIGIEVQNAQLEKALRWFVSEQQPIGAWKLKTVRGKDKDLDLWIGLAICRVLKRFN